MIVLGRGAQKFNKNLYFGMVDWFGGKCDDMGTTLSQILDQCQPEWGETALRNEYETVLGAR